MHRSLDAANVHPGGPEAMSGQNAERAENFDSLNNRLDGILDALNSLGDAPPATGSADTRPLKAVPDLDDSVERTNQSAPQADTATPPAIPTAAADSAAPFESQPDVLAEDSGPDAEPAPASAPPETPIQRPELAVVPTSQTPTIDVPQVPDITEPPVVSALQQVLDAPAPLATPSVADPPTPSVTDLPEVPRVAEPATFEAPVAPESLGVPAPLEVPEVPKAPVVSEIPEIPEVVEVESEAPGPIEAPPVPETPEVVSEIPEVVEVESEAPVPIAAPPVPETPEVVSEIPEVVEVESEAPGPIEAPPVPEVAEVVAPVAVEAPGPIEAPPVPEVADVVAPVAVEAAAVPGIFEVLEAPVVPDVVESVAFEAPAVPETPEVVDPFAIETPAAPEAPVVPDVVEPVAFEAPAVPETPEVVDPFAAVETPGVFEVPEAPEVQPVAFEAPAVPEVSQTPDTPVAPDASPFAFDVPPVRQVAESSFFEGPAAAPDGTVASPFAPDSPQTPEHPELPATASVGPTGYTVPSLPDVPEPPVPQTLVASSTGSEIASPIDSVFATTSQPGSQAPDESQALPAWDDTASDKTDVASGEVDRPMSIFRTSPDDTPAPAMSQPASNDDDDGDWVSHHIIEPERDHGLFDEVPSASAAPTAPTQLEGDALWHVEPYVAPATPEIAGDQSEDLWNTVAETEEILSSLDPSVGVAGAPVGFEAREERVDLAALAPTPVSDAEIKQAVDLTPKYGTDEDLPIPDFTGVYDETPGNWTVPGEDEIASAEGSITQTTAMMRRDELDRLRPAGEVIAESDLEEASGRQPRVVLIAVLFALVALAVFFREELLAFIP